MQLLRVHALRTLKSRAGNESMHLRTAPSSPGVLFEVLCTSASETMAEAIFDEYGFLVRELNENEEGCRCHKDRFAKFENQDLTVLNC